MIDPLGDLLKKYEKKAETSPFGTLPIVVRLDGKSFSKFTKKIKCEKPFDKTMAICMQEVTQGLVEYCNADIGYTQSDEISLVLTKKSKKSDFFFGGRYQKLCSVLSSYATYVFAKTSPWDEMALFDCRVYEVPDKETVLDALTWRAEDCRRNSVSSMAQSNFSHNQLMGKKTWEMKEMLDEIGKPWKDMPKQFRNGVYVKRIKQSKKFTADEIDKLPEKHHARQNPDLEMERMVTKIFSDSILDTDDKMNFVFGK